MIVYFYFLCSEKHAPHPTDINLSLLHASLYTCVHVHVYPNLMVTVCTCWHRKARAVQFKAILLTLTSDWVTVYLCGTLRSTCRNDRINQVILYIVHIKSIQCHMYKALFLKLFIIYFGFLLTQIDLVSVLVLLDVKVYASEGT